MTKKGDALLAWKWIQSQQIAHTVPAPHFVQSQVYSYYKSTQFTY